MAHDTTCDLCPCCAERVAALQAALSEAIYWLVEAADPSWLHEETGSAGYQGAIRQGRAAIAGEPVQALERIAALEADNALLRDKLYGWEHVGGDAHHAALEAERDALREALGMWLAVHERELGQGGRPPDQARLLVSDRSVLLERTRAALAAARPTSTEE